MKLDWSAGAAIAALSASLSRRSSSTSRTFIGSSRSASSRPRPRSARHAPPKRQQVAEALGDARFGARERRGEERFERAGQRAAGLLERREAQRRRAPSASRSRRRFRPPDRGAGSRPRRAVGVVPPRGSSEAQSVALELELGDDRRMDALEPGERGGRAKAGMDLVGRERAADPRLALEQRHRETGAREQGRRHQAVVPTAHHRDVDSLAHVRSARMRSAASWPGAPITPPPG